VINEVFVGVVFGILLFILPDYPKWLWVKMGIKIPDIYGIDDLRQASPIYLLTCVCVLSPLLEEIVFRLVPLSIVMRYGNDYLTWSVAVLASIIFGLIHGSWKHILNLGVFGIVLSWLFINFGFASCLATHITINFLWSCYTLLKRTAQSSPRPS